MISVYYIGAIITALAYLAYAFYIKSRLGLDMSPDGGFYLQLGRGEAVPVPYCLRPVMPMICRDNMTAWEWTSKSAFAMSGGALFMLCEQYCLTLTESFAVCTAFMVTRGFGLYSSRLPVLTDAHGMALALISAVLIMTGNTSAGLCIAFAGALVNEKVPIYAALYSWSLWPLVGLFVVVLTLLVIEQDENDQGIDWLDRPFETSMTYLKYKWASDQQWSYFIAPFGIGLLALFTKSWQVWACFIASLLPLVRSMDYARVTMWALPVLLIYTVAFTPSVLLPLVPLTQLFITSLEPDAHHYNTTEG